MQVAECPKSSVAVQVTKVVLRIDAKVLAGDIPTTHDGDAVVRRQRLVVHATVQSPSLENTAGRPHAMASGTAKNPLVGQSVAALEDGTDNSLGGFDLDLGEDDVSDHEFQAYRE